MRYGLPTSENGWVELYREYSAYWEHGGDVNHPHVELSGGDHSNGFFNSDKVLERPLIAEAIAQGLVGELKKAGFPFDVPDHVIGPAMGAVTLVDFLALEISRLRDRNCMRGFAEKEGGGANKKLVLKRPSVKGEFVLVCEDVSTRIESIGQTAHLVEEAGGEVLPWYVMIVNRSGKMEHNGRKIVALVNRNLPRWPASECPLCKAGSRPLRPKGKEEWAQLNVQY